jgi:hypothetical protein
LREIIVGEDLLNLWFIAHLAVGNNAFQHLMATSLDIELEKKRSSCASGRG